MQFLRVQVSLVFFSEKTVFNAGWIGEGLRVRGLSLVVCLPLFDCRSGFQKARGLHSGCTSVDRTDFAGKGVWVHGAECRRCRSRTF